MFVSEAIAEVMLHVPDSMVLSVNADWAEVQKGCTVAQRSFKLSTYDGNMLDDKCTFAAQMTNAQMHTFYKMVWMEQYNMTPRDHALMHIFADRSKDVENLGCDMKQGNTFHVRAVWGGSDRQDHIIGLVWKHSITMCGCMFICMCAYVSCIHPYQKKNSSANAAKKKAMCQKAKEHGAIPLAMCQNAQSKGRMTMCQNAHR